MIYISRWTVWLVIGALLLSIYFAFPNVLTAAQRADLPGWMPNAPMSLGLDLQGGSYVLLQVDIPGVEQERLDTLRDDLRTRLRDAHIGYKGLASRGGAVTFTVLKPSDAAMARKIVDDLTNPTGTLLGVGAHQYQVGTPSAGSFDISIDPTYARQLATQTVAQSIEVVRRRIDELGTKEPTIEAQGEDRILVQVPGLKDPQELLRILSTTAKMTFQLVDEQGDLQAALQGRVPPEDELLYQTQGDNGQTAPGDQNAQKIPILVQRRIMVSGDSLVQAGSGFDQRTGQPIVTFRFDARGARQFGDVTKTNVGHRFAIVLDNKVLSAPVIQEPILGGTGQISGNFTIQSAHELSILLQAGALPAKLTPIEQRTVGAELGADSITAGSRAAIVGLIAVSLFMLVSYGLFGAFAVTALVSNLLMLVAVLTMLQATLTLPGIAGMVLTMGMAVDANVLIYERIREEMRGGKTVIAAIDAGFRRAMSAIVDSNITTLLAALILFQMGSGPVRGFAVTLGLGILTSLFSALMINRAIVVFYLRRRRPKALAL